MTRPRLLAIACLTALSACSGSEVKETLGMNRVAPDEFRVVSRPPLTVPPQFSLLPPSIEAEQPGHVPASQQARDAVLGSQDQSGATSLDAAPADSKPASKSASKSARAESLKGSASADSAFLKQAGVETANPQIRKELVEERVGKQIEEEQEGWWEKYTIIPGKKDPTVNATKEAERIQENEDTGKPVTEGETPVVKPADRGILGRIMGGD